MNDRNQRTSLTEYFKTNTQDPDARNLLYADFPLHYTWNKNTKKWNKRKRGGCIGRIFMVHPSEGERYYLRLLLTKVKGARSFEELKSVNGIMYTTFKKSAQQRGFLENDNEYRQCMIEAKEFQMPSQLRDLFATLLVFGNITDVQQLWNENFNAMAEDFMHKGISEGQYQIQAVLQSLNIFLQRHARTVIDYDLPELILETEIENLSKILLEELSYYIAPEDLAKANTLNEAQRIVFNEVLNLINQDKGGVLFIDGPAGSGKTYVYDCLLSHIRSNHQIALAVASSGIAALLLHGGRTAHSRFKIPIIIDENATCNIKKGTDLAILLQKAVLIIWDEAPMLHRHVFEAVDKTLRDIMENNFPFGNKIFLFGGDFRQVLPIISKGTRAQIVNASFNKSYLWPHIRIFSLTTNIRISKAINNKTKTFADYLLRIGNGTEPTIENDLIRLPDEIIIRSQNNEDHINLLINAVYPNLTKNILNTAFITERAILTSLNSDVDEINERIITICPGNQYTYYSFDSTTEDNLNLFPVEYLNSLTPPGLPPHILSLKVVKSQDMMKSSETEIPTDGFDEFTIPDDNDIELFEDS
ncbi:4110_t:CDS:2 [Acaulospora morrowiae]|uniref:ATP-dependent DNA helicase n=1 Tax=Acaulospora morrowiae TaxID=94023 RepID=A0A9N8Z3L9_9GLOM|nr:4110_t:CDS:2 [Acaulospora morrowiae]